MASAAAFGLGHTAANRARAEATCTSTAMVYCSPAVPTADFDDIRQQIQSLAEKPGDLVAANLQVNGGPTTKAGELGISLAYTDHDPARSAEVANKLAQSYADAFRTEWKAGQERFVREAHAATARAENEYQQARSKLDQLSNHQSQAVVSPPPAAAPPAAAPAVAMVDNPAWSVLSQKMAALYKHREQLLEDRTPLHPAVAEVDLRIADLQQEMSGVPKQIPSKESVVVAPTAAPVTEKQTVDLQTLLTLQGAVERTSAAYEKAKAAERQLAKSGRPEAPIEIEPAQPVELAVTEVDLRGLIWASLGAGLAVTAGTALVSLWAAREKIVTSLAQIQLVMPAPIVGVVGK